MSLNRICLLNRCNVISGLVSKNDIVNKLRYDDKKRYFSTTPTSAEKLAQNVKPDWNRAVSEAEKIVGYPTSFLSLRWLLSDEIANVALHLRKLVGSNHPLLKTAKNLLYNGKNNMQAWGLIVLLVSKAAGHTTTVPDLEQDKAAGVLHSQRALAEVTEMIRTSHLVHQGLVNLQPGRSNIATEMPQQEELTFGNKIALLSGDYLLGNSCVELANLRNQDIVELMSSALRDLAESEFIGVRDLQNNPLPTRTTKTTNDDGIIRQFSDEINNLNPITMQDAMGNPEQEWALRNILSAGSLLGKSCQGALKLGGHPDSTQVQGYMFGKHLALAWQACIDIEPFQSKTLPSGTKFSLVSAPVLFHLEHDPTLYSEIEKGIESVDNIDYGLIHSAVIEGPGVALTKELQRKHSLAASEVLSILPPTDARTALNNIIVAMQDL